MERVFYTKIIDDKTRYYFQVNSKYPHLDVELTEEEMNRLVLGAD